MKVSGFTIVRNAIKFDYPVVESIQSILPLCDEMIVSVGNSEDDTLALICSINSPKIKIIESVWDDSLREGGKVLAVETDKAKAQLDPASNWAFYIQADEVLHEKYIPILKEAMLKWKDDKKVEGLLFNYTHFFGSYEYVADSRKWYRNEIRIIKNDSAIFSWLDAISFRKKDVKLKVKTVDASIHHYGWVKTPASQQAKQQSFHKMWHNDNWVKENVSSANEYDYSNIDSLKLFEGTHPLVMLDRIKSKKWKFEYDPTKKNLSFKNKMLQLVGKIIGYRVGEYKNYILLKD